MIEGEGAPRANGKRSSIRFSAIPPNLRRGKGVNLCVQMKKTPSIHPRIHPKVDKTEGVLCTLCIRMPLIGHISVVVVQCCGRRADFAICGSSLP